MNSTSNKLTEILKLNRQLRNALSFKGGAQKLINFKEKLIEHKSTIFYLYILCFFTILYFSVNNYSKNTVLKGGNVSDALKNISDSIQKNLPPIINKANSGIEKIYQLMDKIISGTPIVPVILPFLIIIIINLVISIRTGSATFFLFWLIILIIIILIIIGTSGILLTTLFSFKTISIVYLLLIYIICNIIVNVTFYMPCYMCEEDNSLYKCIPGTGKGSAICTMYTEFIEKLKFIIRQLKYIKNIIPKLKEAINKAINSILYIVYNISKWVTLVFSTGIEKIFSKLMFLRKLNIPDNWGFNFGEFIICPDFNTKGKACIYNSDGSLRSSHGNNPVFKVFWKMIRIILELPPPVPKFPFSGGTELKLNNLKAAKINQPKRKTHTIDTTTKTVSKKQPRDINIAYKKLLEALIKIEINPIKWIAALFNLLIEAINLIMIQLVNMLKIILSFVFKLITVAANAINGAFKKIINTILKPLNEVANIAMKIPKELFKAVSKIFAIGPFTIITYYFYNMLVNLFPFLDKLRSFIIIIAIIILIHGILIFCPIIGGLYALKMPITYVYNMYIYFKNIYNNGFKDILDKIHKNILENNEIINSFKNYIEETETMYKIIAVIFIIILIVFIILNYFYNVNRILTKYATKLIYGHYYNKYDNIRKKYLEYKLNSFEFSTTTQTNQEEKDKKKDNSNTYFNNLLKLGNLNNNQLDNLNINNLI